MREAEGTGAKKVREAKCAIERARDVSVRACDVSERASL